VLPKTLALIELDLGHIYYDTNVENANQDYWQIFGGLRGELSDDFEITMKLGYQGRDMGDVPGTRPKQAFNGFVAKADMSYRLTNDDIFHSGYERTVKTSTFGVNSWYRQDSLFISYRKRLADKWFVTPRVSWQMNEYPESSTLAGETRRRDDHFWQAGIRLQYKVQDWLWAGARYNFRHRNSDFDTLDYSNNRLSVDMTLSF